MKCKICEQEAWSNTDYCPKHDLSFREKKTMYRIWDTVSNEFCNIENKLFSERFEFPTKKEAEDRVELAWQRTGKYYLDPKKQKWFRNKSFRQACAYAVNYQQLINIVYNKQIV